MRDLEHWKDKVELSLDGRQIFFLFFGSAVAACLIFVLGVLIGKRLEARALALAPPPVDDPLRALDELGELADEEEGLTFHKTLTREPAAARAVAAAPKPEPAEPKRAEPAPPPAPAPAAPTPPAAPKKVETARALPTLPKAPLPAAKPQVVAAPAPATAAAAKKQDATAAHFTLQLSAFPEKADADEFMRKIQSAGYRPFVVASEVPGKGVFYRVRVGDYGSKQAAVDAKNEFERKQRMIAYVAKL
jgi:cell division septation protein DedD